MASANPHPPRNAICDPGYLTRRLRAGYKRTPRKSVHFPGEVSTVRYFQKEDPPQDVSRGHSPPDKTPYLASQIRVERLAKTPEFSDQRCIFVRATPDLTVGNINAGMFDDLDHLKTYFHGREGDLLKDFWMIAPDGETALVVVHVSPYHPEKKDCINAGSRFLPAVRSHLRKLMNMA